jgi:hypothetical protein
VIKFIQHRYRKYTSRLFFLFYRWRNIILQRKKILLYTDSRGKDILKRNDYDYYSQKLAKKYAVKPFLCPEKWTTTLDFLQLIKTIKLDKFDLIILHTGVVDFSPRFKSDLCSTIYPQKKAIFDEIFGEAIISQHLTNDLGVQYENEMTCNMYSLKMAKKHLLPQLKKIDNLIWISGNIAFPNWRGNYFRDRPQNINQNDDYFYLFEKYLPNVVSTMNWTTEEVKEYTYDIIHPNKKGSDVIFQKLEEVIKAIPAK